MATIYKRNKQRKNEPYWIQYQNHDGKRRTIKGFTDKGLTEQLAAKLETEARLRTTGLIDGQMERLAQHKLVPIEQHLAAFEKSSGGKDNTRKYVGMLMTRVRRIVQGCGFESIGQIDREAVQAFLAEQRAKKKFGVRTYNHYVQGMDAFCRWLVATQRLLTNPVSGLPRLNAETDVRHRRRALSSSEFAKLVQAARTSGKEVQRYSGEQRARLYLLAYMTGLRKGELASLMPRSFDLDAVQPVLVVEAKASKHRRQDVLPLHPELVKMPREWLRGVGQDEPLFSRLAGKKTWVMVKTDLESAGIPYQTADGIADFHAAGRHTHITELLRSGASLPEARKLARHSDIRMTMRYTHIGIEDQARALAGLRVPEPAIPPSGAGQCALQMRCISGGREGHSQAAADRRWNVDRGRRQTKTPAGAGVVANRDNPCQVPAEPGKMEAAGIEPAS